MPKSRVVILDKKTKNKKRKKYKIKKDIDSTIIDGC